jgi:hypothetical protein
MSQPVGEMRKLVSLVDRGDADAFFYPKGSETVFLQNFKPYHNFSQETVELPYTGAANWGQRITFTMPHPWLGDCLSWIGIRFAPETWLPGEAVQGLLQGPPYERWSYNDISGAWMWASNLGSSAIELVEMEINGVVIEQWSGDWIDVWQKLYLDSSKAAGYEDSVVGTVNRELYSINGAFRDNPCREAAPINTVNIDAISGKKRVNIDPGFYGDNVPPPYIPPEEIPFNKTFIGAMTKNFLQIQKDRNFNTFDNHQTVAPSEDGYVYAMFPFWFARRRNTAFPMLSVYGEGNIRFHITFRKFNEVIRKTINTRACGENMLGSNLVLTNNNIVIPKQLNAKIQSTVPALKDASLMCGLVHLDGGIRETFMKQPHEDLIEPVLTIPFSEPLKYAINTGQSDTITVSLPLDAANGPIKELIWFIRRKAVYKYNSWTNYGAYLEDEVDPVFKPQRPLMKKAVLRVGTVPWADQNELWWRTRGALNHPGGIRVMNSYIYEYSFAADPVKFGPTGSINSSRAPIRLELTIEPPDNVDDKEWEVQVFILSHNWLRYENGLCERVYRD